MALSPYLRRLRDRVGHDLLQLPSVAGLLRDSDGRVLLAHDVDTDRWVLPGGCVEPLERPADALVRELQEETGLVVRPVRVAAVLGGPEFTVRYRNGDEVSYVLTLFACEIAGGTLRPDGDEVAELRWVAPAELARLTLPRWAEIALPLVLADGDRAAFEPPSAG